MNSLKIKFKVVLNKLDIRKYEITYPHKKRVGYDLLNIEVVDDGVILLYEECDDVFIQRLHNQYNLFLINLHRKRVQQFETSIINSSYYWNKRYELKQRRREKNERCRLKNIRRRLTKQAPLAPDAH